MKGFRFLIFTPAGHDDPSLAIAASRAGNIGIFNAECHPDTKPVIKALERLAEFVHDSYGLKLGRNTPADLLDYILDRYSKGLHWVVFDAESVPEYNQWISAYRKAGGRVLAELCRWEDSDKIGSAEIDGWIVKGHEAGGPVGEETSFILLQKALAATDIPVYVHGGVGIHTAAACYTAGASGVVLDNQLLLLRESPLKDALQPVVSNLVGNETVALGDTGEGLYFRILERPGFLAAKHLRSRLTQLPFEELYEEARSACGWLDPQNQVMPLGQDVAFAAPWAKRYRTVAGVVAAMRLALLSHLQQASELRALSADAPLAASHGTRYSIVQGPMTRVSDTAGFAEAVAAQGGLPMLALALMKGPAVRKLLNETTDRLHGQPWGVGILGFAPADLLTEQIAISREFKPAFALIAGGRPEQALALEESGVPSYLHVPSPRLLSMFLEHGARRFVFEGRECGGHIGPLASFVLWESMVDTLLAEVEKKDFAQQIHVLFAGGIHDAQSAAMVAVLSAPLSARGIKVGVLMGSAYLFTREIVSSGSIVETFQKQVLECDRTVGLETGTGHASRCGDTDFAKEFLQLKAKMLAQGKSADEIREALEDLNLGRLRLASKGKERTGPEGRISDVPVNRQVRDGMYMLGQVATLSAEVSSVEQLHQSVSEGACDYIERRLSDAIQAEQTRAQAAEPADIAIIGIGAYLPGAGDTREYWNNILNHVDAITEIPSDRWDWRIYFDSDRHAKDKIYSKWGGFLEDMVFDPMHYGIPPRAVKAIDPLQLMTLEVLRQTMQDAGYEDREFDRENVSIILGASGGAGDVGAQYAVRSELPRFTGELTEEVAEHLPGWTEDSFAGILLNVAAGRAANRFNFGGLNFTVDAACASSLAAVHQGVVELEDGRSDMVIVGGVDTVQGPFGYLCFSQTQALSPRGKCSTFDTGSDGIVISEGIAMLCMKRLADAERDGDRIYAVIKGVGGSSDGRAKSMTAPHPDGQIRALERAYNKAGYSPASVGLLEAHGTGTVAGDTAELETVMRLLDKNHALPKQCAIGSVKTLIGHTKATAGVAGLIKSTLALHHRILPPHANVETPNSRIADDESPLYLLREPQPWIMLDGEKRRSGVSAFGFGGTNFHITLEEYSGDYLRDQQTSSWDDWPAELFVWRKADNASLISEIGKTINGLESGGDPGMRDLAAALARNISPGGRTATIVASSREDLLRQMRLLVAHLEDNTNPLPPATSYSAEPLGDQGKIALLFAGQGSQYPNMLRQLAIVFPDIPAVLSKADELLADRLESSAGKGARLSRMIYTPGLYSAEDEADAARLLTKTEITQPALGAVEAGLWHILQRFNLKPDMAAGHSYGEFVALYAAGAISLDSLLKLSEARGRFIKEAGNGDGLGTMAAVRSDRATVEKIAGDYPDVLVANHNAPQQSILSGSIDSINAIVEKLNQQKIDARALQVGAAFHSPFVMPAKERLAEFIETLSMQSPEFPVYSNTTAQVHSEDVETLRSTLAEHLTSPVEFVNEVEAMYDAGARIFIGLGPKNVQTTLADQILQQRPHRTVRIDDNEGGLKGFLQALGVLLSEGVDVDINPLFESRECRSIDLDKLSAVSQEQPRPAHAWLLNGGSARPANEPAVQPLTIEQIEKRKKQQAAIPAGAGVAHSPVTNRNSLRRKENMSENQPALAEDESPPPTEGELAYSTGSEKESLFAAYQETMRQFLQVQESIMIAYLTGAPAQGTSRLTAPARQRNTIPSRPVRARTAMPRPTPAAARAPEPVAAVAPVPAQPAVEAPSAAATATPSLVKTPAAAAAPATSAEKPDVAKMLLEIVEERTGYPQDMLGLDQNLEADLGIDSIKRVEIVGTLLKALPPDLVSAREDASESLNGMKTLQGMIDFLTSLQGQEGAASSPFEQTGAGETEQSGALLPRFIIQAQLENIDGVELDPPGRGVYLITDDGNGVGRHVAEQLKAEGAQPVFIPETVLSDDAALQAFIEDARQQGAITGLVHLLPLSSALLSGDSGISEWRSQTRRNELSLYRLLQLTSDDLQHGGRILAATAMGGYFGRQSAPAEGISAQGGAPGLLKSVNDEWSSVHVKAVDLDSAIDPADNARFLYAELCLPGGRIEIGYPGGERTIFTTRAATLDEAGSSAPRQPDSSWVILATGGARGITAEVLMGLAEKGLTMILVGRSPEPPEEEANIAVLKTETEVKRYLLEKARAEYRSPKPVEIERELNTVMRDREIRANIKDFRDAGARVDYRVADVRDEEQVSTLLNDIYSQYGRLDGVVHGAGIIEDRLIVDKNPDSVARVFDTKVDSAFLLSRYLRPDQLRFLVFFTSVAGRYGNTGQTDYATANEVVNRMAWQLYNQWQGKIKVAAINWGPWEATRYGKGMVTPEARRKFEAMGVVLVDPAAGRQLFMDEISFSPLSQVEVIAGEGPWEAREAEKGAMRAAQSAADVNNDHQKNAAYPLIAGASQSSGPRGEIIFRRTVNVQHDYYLSQHLLDGTPVMPAAVALELIAEAAASAWPDWVVNEVGNLRVLNGIKLNQGAVDLEVVALASSHGDASGFEASLVIRPAGEETKPCYRASVRLGSDALESTPYQSTLQAGKTTADVEHAYREWLFHGPCLQTIQSISFLEKRGALAMVKPSNPQQWLPTAGFDKAWLFDPGIIDSAPQMAIIWAHVIRSASALPSHFGRVTRFGSGEVGICQMHFLTYVDQTEDQVKADVAFVDENNQLRLLIEEMECTSSAALVRLGGGWKDEIDAGATTASVAPVGHRSSAGHEVSD
jgi:acyl transferase domain-containing protein/NAD(P)H-dependent flavin oxidoreductase YrpB (nitropropane dioxygenase family)/NADP-dependent 3-hydroxy acid dehydrogenase YdfG